MTQTTSVTTPDEVSGPIDFLLIEFPTDRLTGRAAVALGDLIESGTIHLYDLVVVSKDPDGSVAALELSDDGSGFAEFAGARSGLLGDDDVAEAAEAIAGRDRGRRSSSSRTPGRAPFVAAARDSGGEVIASGRIPAGDIMDALDALEAAG